MKSGIDSRIKADFKGFPTIIFEGPYETHAISPLYTSRRYDVCDHSHEYPLPG